MMFHSTTITGLCSTTTCCMLDFVVIGLLSVLQANQKGESCYIITLNISAHDTPHTIIVFVELLQ